jgi:hypothetical protein
VNDDAERPHVLQGSFTGRGTFRAAVDATGITAIRLHDYVLNFAREVAAVVPNPEAPRGGYIGGWTAAIAAAATACEMMWLHALSAIDHDDRYSNSRTLRGRAQVYLQPSSGRSFSMMTKDQRFLWEDLFGDRVSHWSGWSRYSAQVEMRNVVVHTGLRKDGSLPNGADAIEAVAVGDAVHDYVMDVLVRNGLKHWT